jgi:hypothetical protein
MSDTSNEDLERLASRMALLVAEGGEADAAGRAVGAMARKLGLSGGHLKAIFLAGAGRLGAVGRQAAEQSARAERAEDLAHGLRHSLDQIDFALAQAQRDASQLREENERLRDALDRARTGRQVQLILGVLVLLALTGGFAFAWFGAVWRPHPVSSAEAGLAHGAFVRRAGVDLRAQPDFSAPVIGHLAGGTRVPVQGLSWHNFVQWAELRLGDRTGYCAATDLDLD